MVLFVENGVGIILAYGDVRMRNIIYIGELSEGKVYYDMKKDIALICHNMEKSDFKIVFLGLLSIIFSVLTFFGVRILRYFFAYEYFILGVYSVDLMFFLSILWIVECFLFIYGMEKALYDDICCTQAKMCSDKFLKKAIKSNKFYAHRLAHLNKIYTAIFVIFVIILGFSPGMILWIMYYHTLGTPVDNEIIAFTVLGIMPAMSIYVSLQNNPYRWLKAVERSKMKKYK